MVILGIETSCDETAASVVKDGEELISNVVFSSMDLHKAYGGVVPEIAARSHVEAIIPVIIQALEEALPHLKPQSNTSNLNNDPWSFIDGIAVTFGAGLGSSLLVGVMTARTLAIAKNKPLYGINHIESHVYANFLTKTNLHGYQLPIRAPIFPLLALTVSGKHSQLVLFKNHFNYKVLGCAIDDAVGEAFDKVARIVGLPYPGGPSISKVAPKGNPSRYEFPKSKLQGKYDFSFSGLKTAILRLAQSEIGEDYTFPSKDIAKKLSDTQKNDIAASFQRIAIETLVDKSVLAFEEFSPKSLVIAGGVAANQELRRQLTDRIPIDIEYTDIKLCTDNGAMVATLGCYKAMHNQHVSDPYSLDINPNLKM